MEEVKFTAKEEKFIEAYVACLNAAQAAREAKYSTKTAKEIGYENLTKPHIKSEIQKRLKAEQLDADGTKKLISKIASANVNKYLKIIKVPHIPTIKVPLSKIIKEIEEQISFEEEYASLVDMDNEEAEEYELSQKSRRKKIIRLQVELRRNSKAFRERDGDTIMVEKVELDLVALARDKENGIIKSYKMTKEGAQIEFCSVDSQLTNLARINGMMKDNIDVTTNGETLNNKVTPDQAKALLAKLQSAE